MGEPRLVTSWEGLTKNAEGEAEIHLLHKYDHQEAADIAGLFVSQAGLLVVRHDGPDHDIAPVRFTARGMVIDGKRYDV